MYDELVKSLRNDSGECGVLGKVKWSADFSRAADAIEELLYKLCDWCGVCPESRRNPYDCEIIFPNAPVPEVYIDTTKEETE